MHLSCLSKKYSIHLLKISPLLFEEISIAKEWLRQREIFHSFYQADCERGRLCLHAIFRGSHRLYSEYLAQVFKVLINYSPLVEPISLDEAFVDLIGYGKLHGPTLKIAKTIRNEIRD